jgi:methionine-gamma-lyase
MAAFGGLVACESRGGKKEGMAFMNTEEERRKHGISDGLIRFSIGLETLSDLKDDIFQALDADHL